jgi:4-hydroxyphenylacetate 3-monooxygenase
MIMLPSGAEDLRDPELAAWIRSAQGSSAGTPDERMRFFKLAWDAVGSEFASRHTQYEMFYAGAGFVTKGHSMRTYDWQSAQAMVARALEPPAHGAAE